MRAKGLLSLLALSEKRREILFMLQEEPKTLKEIRDHFGITSPEIIPQIRKLEKENLIIQNAKKYVLTEVGEIAVRSFGRFFKTLKIFESNMEFWKEHNIRGIPEEFQMRLHELDGYKIFESTPTEIFKPHDEYIKNLLKSKRIRGVSPALHPEYPASVTLLAEKGVDISIVVTKDVFEKLQTRYRKEVREYLSFENASLLLCNEKIKVAFTASDKFLSMRLFLKDGNYDFYKNIINYEKPALKWGEDLFSYYEGRSKKIGLKDF